MKTYIIKYGLIGGLLLTLNGLLNWFVIAPKFSVSASQGFGYLGITLCLLCVPLGIKYYRDKVNNGIVSFGQGFKIGISITLVVSVMMFFYGMLFFILQGAKFQEWQLKDLQGQELADMEAQLAAMPEFAMTPWFQGVILFFMILTIGLIMTLLGALLLKSVNRQKPN